MRSFCYLRDASWVCINIHKYIHNVKKSKIFDLTRQIKRTDEKDLKMIKLADQLKRLSIEYDKKSKEINDIREEVKRTELYDINLDDLNLSFEQIIKSFNKLDEETKEMINVYFMQIQGTYGLDFIEQSTFGQ